MRPAVECGFRRTQIENINKNQKRATTKYLDILEVRGTVEDKTAVAAWPTVPLKVEAFPRAENSSLRTLVQDIHGEVLEW